MAEREALARIGRELKKNPPDVLAKTRKKFGGQTSRSAAQGDPAEQGAESWPDPVNAIDVSTRRATMAKFGGKSKGKATKGGFVASPAKAGNIAVKSGKR